MYMQVWGSLLLLCNILIDRPLIPYLNMFFCLNAGQTIVVQNDNAVTAKLTKVCRLSSVIGMSIVLCYYLNLRYGISNSLVILTIDSNKGADSVPETPT
jgi:hypothetical protein